EPLAGAVAAAGVRGAVAGLALLELRLAGRVASGADTGAAGEAAAACVGGGALADLERGHLRVPVGVAGAADDRIDAAVAGAAVVVGLALLQAFAAHAAPELEAARGAGPMTRALGVVLAAPVAALHLVLVHHALARRVRVVGRAAGAVRVGGAAGGLGI